MEGTCAEDDPCGCGLIYQSVCCDGHDFASRCDAECVGIEHGEETCLKFAECDGLVRVARL